MPDKKTFSFVLWVLAIALILILVYLLYPKLEEPFVELELKEEAVEKLFSEELVQFLNDNFEVIEKQGDIADSPEEFLNKKKGGEIDFAVYLASQLKTEGLQVVVMRYLYERDQRQGINTVVVFADRDAPKYIYLEQGKIKMTAHGKSFEDLYQLEEARLGVTITGVAVFEPNILNLKVEQWEKRY